MSLTAGYFSAIPAGLMASLSPPMAISVLPATPLPSAPQPPAGLLDQLAIDAATRQATVTAAGTPIPVIYGRQRIGAHIIAAGMIDDDLVLGCAWCMGEIDAIEAVEINDQAAPGAVTVTHYLGTAVQGVDATLAAAINGYADTLRGTVAGQAVSVAYSVLRIPPGAVEGWPNVAAVIRGRKLYDPRTLATAYSTNPALALRDFIASPVYGQGLAVVEASFSALADANDEPLANGSKRREINLIIDSAAPAVDWVEALRAYAGCWVIPAGAARKVAADRPAAAVATLTAADVVAGSLRITKRRRRDAPTVVRVRYTDTGATPWRDGWATAYAPGVQAGATPWRDLEVALPGITSYARAYREAVERLNALHQSDIEAAWRAFDEAIAFEVGDVVELTHPIGLTAKLLRITAIEPAEIGRYTITAVEYSAAAYSDAIDIVSPGDSALPSATHIDAPVLGLPVSGSAHLVELGDGTIISRLFVQWTPPQGQYYHRAEVRFKRLTDTLWQAGAVDQANHNAYCSPVEDGAVYEIEVVAVNVFGVPSTAASTTHTIVGQTEPPGPPRQFFISRDSDGTRRFSWLPPDPLPADVRSGGGYRLRYGLGLGVPLANMAELHTGVITASPYETNQLAAGTYTFAITTVDRTGNESNPVYIEATLGDPRLAGALEVIVPHLEGWPGTKSSCVVDAGTGWLVATDSKAWADLAGTQWGSWTSWSQASNTMIYTHDTIDVGLVTQFTPLISLDYIGSAAIEVRTSNDGVAWSAWAAPAGQVTARYIEVRCTVSGNGNLIKSLSIILDAAPMTEDISDRDTASLTGGYRIGVGDIRLPVTKPFSLIRKIEIALQNVGPGWSWEVIDKSTVLGPRIKIYNASNTLADATIDATIRGVS